MTKEELVKKDNTFKESAFIAKVDNTYIMLLTAITTENLPRVKHKVSDELYQKLIEKLENLKQENVIQMYDELNVKTSFIKNITEELDYYEITVCLISRYLEYKIDKTTRKYKSGNNQSRVEKTHTLIFRKKKTAQTEGISRKCPSCGAPVDTNNTGVCPYCHSTYNTKDYDWVLVSIDENIL